MSHQRVMLAVALALSSFPVRFPAFLARRPLRPADRERKMAVDERGRLQLADAAKRAFGDEAGITLMELLPPVGWADVATKQDLARLDLRFDALEGRMDAFESRLDRMESKFDDVGRELRAQTWKLMTLMVAVVGVVVAAVRL
jgi:hypothetical protein